MQRSGRFSNRPIGVKHFEAIHLFSVNVAHGLVLLFGIGTKALVWGLRHLVRRSDLVASLIGRLGSSTFRLSTSSVSMSLTGSCFSSESAQRPLHHGSRGRGGTIFRAALPSHERQVQATKRTHLIHRPARDIFPPQGWNSSFPPIGFDPVQLSCCYRGPFPGPAELGAVNPDAVHAHSHRRASATIAFFIPRHYALWLGPEEDPRDVLRPYPADLMMRGRRR